MGLFLRVMRAEALKQHRQYFHSMLIYFSMLIWPAILAATIVYTYRPFTDPGAFSGKLARALGTTDITLFVLAGYLGYTFFYGVLQSAWMFSFGERFWGTFELLFLTPASRFALALGNALAGLVESVWLFTLFAVMGGAIWGEGVRGGPWPVLFTLLLLLVSAASWGTFLNSAFAFSRDSGFIYSLLQEPLVFFSGVRFPAYALPLWGRLVSYVFPLTFSLGALRKTVLGGAGVREILPETAAALALSGLLLVLSAHLLRAGERRLKKTGNAVLF